MIYDRSVINPGTDGRIHISLPAKAPVDLTNATVNFARPRYELADDEDAACTGTYSAPTAPSGKVCLYRFISEDVDHIDGRSSFMLADSGFYINFIETGIAGNDLYLNFTWAYTAP